MGAWGFSLFQSDHDYEMIVELSDEAGLRELEDKEQKESGEEVVGIGRGSGFVLGIIPWENGAKYFCRAKMGCDPVGLEAVKAIATGQTFYTIYAEACSNPLFVRDHLEKSGSLAKLFAKYETKLPSTPPNAYHKDGYKFILLGACAMTLGCHIPNSYRSLMAKHFTSVGLMREAVKQVQKALNGPDGYKDGTPYDFESMCLWQALDERGGPMADRINQGGSLINVREPNIPMKLSEPQMQYVKNKMAEGVYADDVCAGCGGKQGKDGGELQQCGQCKQRLYCSAECQRKHWPLHQKLCGQAKVKWSEKDEKYKDVLLGLEEKMGTMGLVEGQQSSSKDDRFDDWDAMDKLAGHIKDEAMKMQDDRKEEAKKGKKKKSGKGKKKS